MTTDLWLSKKDQLQEWMKQKKVFTSSDVIKWGLENYHIRSDRDKRDFLEQGLIRKIDNWWKETKQGTYEYIGNGK